MIRPLLCTLLAATLMACKEARSPTGPTPQGPDVEGPELVLRPAIDTLVDSTGVLEILVISRDRSNIKTVDLSILGGGFTFPTLTPNDTAFTAVFPVGLNPLKNSAFRYVARAVDVLDHETVSDTVTVTVR